MARPCSRALLLALALAGAHSALAQTAAEAVAPVAAIAAPAVDSAALAIATDANPTVYAAVTAEAPPVLPAAPVVAEAPQAGVSAWVVPSDTQAAAGGMWNTQRLLEAAVGLSFLVLVFFFIINSTRQAFENWEVEKSGEGGLKGQGGGPGEYGALGDSFREASGLYPVKLGGYAPNSPALPVGLRTKNSSSGNLLEPGWDEERGAAVDPWESHQNAHPQPSRVRQDPPASYRGSAGASRGPSGDRQSSRVPSGDRASAQHAPQRVASGGSGGGSGSSRGSSAHSSSRAPSDAYRSSTRGGASQSMQRGPYQAPPRNL